MAAHVFAMVVVAVLVLFAGVESPPIPVAGVTRAVFVMVPLPPAVPVTVRVTLPPLGNAGITTIPDCKLAMVRFAKVGQAAPPEMALHTTLLAVKLAALASVIVELSAAIGPLLVIINV